jgi:hypothetical protein
MKRAILILFLFVCSKSVFAQKPCDKDTIYSQFDYWVGDWEVYDLNGNVTGNSKISTDFG